jgi:hypothetical protein
MSPPACREPSEKRSLQPTGPGVHLIQTHHVRLRLAQTAHRTQLWSRSILEIGGSNDIANLYPEPGSGPASYHVKDKLENKLHALVCAGSMTLHAAQVGIAHNWETLYKTVFGVAP